MNKKKILITGGAGFVGYHLAKHLLFSTDAMIVLIDNLSRGQTDEEFRELISNPRVTFIEGDLTKPDAYNVVGSGYEHVYHLAAVNGTKHFYAIPHEVLRVNILSLIYALEWFKEKNAGGKFCFTSSNEAYAGGLNAFGILPIPTPENVPLVIEDTYNPRWSYGGSKLIGELLVIHYAKAYNLRACIVRPHNFYGPRAGWDHVIPELSIRIANHIDPFELYGKDDTRTFCYIEDGVQAMQMLMDSSGIDTQPIGTFHIGDNNEISIENLAETLFKVAEWRPQHIAMQSAPIGSVKRRMADITRIEKIVGWKPHTALKDGLAKTYAWYATHRSKDSS